MKIQRIRPELIILTILAFATRLWQLFQPASVVFDEVYFKVFAGDYFTHAYYFDIHPPLGKLLLAGWAWLLHLNPAALVDTAQPSVALRLLPAIAGALIVPVFYWLLLELRASRLTACMGAALLVVENALIVESRFILVDSLLILFGLTALACGLAARRYPQGSRRLLWLLAASLLAGAATSVKWTGLPALGLIGLAWLWDQARHYRLKHPAWSLAEGLILITLPALVYLSVFFIHFQLLNRSGQGDAFMSTRFQATLKGSAYHNAGTHMPFIEKFVELNQEMQSSEDSLKHATHPYGSRWYSWPIMIRDVYYWQGPELADGRQGNIYLLGNPLIWWGILLSIPLCLVVLTGRIRHIIRPYRFSLALLVIGYAANFLPFIGIVRVMFLYHYFFALIYSLALALLLLQIVLEQFAGLQSGARHAQTRRIVYGTILAAAVASFIYFAPLTYGLPLSPASLQAHMWLKTWR